MWSSKAMPKALAVLPMLLLVMFMAAAPARAQIETEAEYAVLIDSHTGAVLFEKDAHTLMAPASMSKLMTLAMVFEELRRGHLTFEDTFVVSQHAVKSGGFASGASNMALKVGERVRLTDLILGIIVQSANDASIVVAEGLAGSEDEFAARMTEFAREIGLKQATFGNSTGLPHPNQRMTAHELALLARYLIREFPEYYKYFAQRTYSYNGTPFANRNPLLTMGIGADGLKTGYTKESGYGVVGSAVIGGRRLIIVINGAKTAAERGTEAKKLLEWGAKNFKQATIFEDGEIVSRARVWGGSKYFVNLVGAGPVKIVVPRFASSSRLKASIVYEGPLKPPVKKGDQVAVLRVETADAGTSEIPLYAAEDVERAGMLARGVDSLVLLGLSWLP
jgi:D-alanyl-D-alanine carboxypeptidase (penicillin-binding protein 5/6)